MKRFSLKKGITWFWILNGIVISLLVTGMYATGSKSLTNSLKFGKVCEYMYGGLTYTNDADNRRDVQLSDNAFLVNFNNGRGKWKYIYFNVNTDIDMEWFISFYTAGNKLLFQKSAAIEDGVNKLELPGKSFSHAVVSVMSPEKISFTLKNAQIREKEKIEFQLRHVVFFLISMLMYAGIVYAGTVITKKRNIRFYRVIDVLQDIYISVGNSFLWLGEKATAKQKHIFRVGLLMFWQIFIMYTANMRIYERFYKYVLVIICIAIGLIAISMLEKPLQKVKWKNPIVFYWFLLSVVMCLSEYIFPKRYLLTGVINLTLFGFLYFVWNNMEDRSLFLREIMLSLKGIFFFVIIFCIGFRPMIDDVVYPGPTWNVNAFATYLVPLIVALLTEMYMLWNKKEKKKFVIDAILLLSAISFVQLTGSRAGYLLAYVVVLLYLLYMWKIVKIKTDFRRIMIVGICLCILVVPVRISIGWAVKHIPQAIGMEVEFPRDNYKAPVSNVAVSVQAAEEETIIEKIVYAQKTSKYLTGRNFIWMGYLRNLNVIGHVHMPVLWRGYALAHNGILEMGYRYGIFAMMPFAFLSFGAIYYSFYDLDKRKNKVRDSFSFFVFALFVVSACYMMIESIERPFLITEWIIFYLLLGYLFPADREDVLGDER